MADDKSIENTEESDEVEVQEQTVSLFLAIGMVVGSLIIGLVVGYMVAPKDQAGLADPIGGTSTAPSLSEDQLNEGQLPDGHPAIPEAPAGTTGTTGATTDTDTGDEATGTDAGTDDGATDTGDEDDTGATEE